MKKFTFSPIDLRCRVSRVGRWLAGSVAAVVACNAPSVRADTYLPTSGTASWNLGANWDTSMVPNAVGASVFFGNGTGNRTIQTDSGAAGFTVGSISFDINSSATNSITTGSNGSNLTLDNGGAGVTITTSGFGAGNNTISVRLVLNDLVTAQVDQTSSSSGAGSLNLTAAISGTGGVVKQGDGLMTYGTGAKTYTGPTVLNGGRTRISQTAQPSATSSFTINDGAQLTLIAANPATFAFGSGSLNLNGSGATSGPFSAFPGAIRNDTGYVATINNPSSSRRIR
jgi:autotransporter-associated beta strand protein